MNAEFLRQFTYETPPQVPLKRTSRVQSAYDHFSRTQGPTAFITGIQQILKTKKYILTENMFPYKVKPPIQHKCLWYTGVMTKQDIHTALADEGIESITFFENPHDLKSIKNIKHYHVFHY